MAEKLPRPTDYDAQSPEGASGKYATADELPTKNFQPYGTASWSRGVLNRARRLKDIERNTGSNNGTDVTPQRASREARLSYGRPAPGKADPPEVAAKSLPTPEPYGNQRAPIGQGGPGGGP